MQFIPYEEAYEPGFEDMERRVPSLEKLIRLTGFRPTTPLTAIVDKVTTHFQENKRARPAESLVDAA